MTPKQFSISLVFLSLYGSSHGQSFPILMWWTTLEDRDDVTLQTDDGQAHLVSLQSAWVPMFEMSF